MIHGRGKSDSAIVAERPLRAESSTPGPGERFRSLHWSCGDNSCPTES